MTFPFKRNLLLISQWMISHRKFSKILEETLELQVPLLPFLSIQPANKRLTKRKKKVPLALYWAVSKRLHKKFNWMNKLLTKNKFCRIEEKLTLRWFNHKRVSFLQFLPLQFCCQLFSFSVLLPSFLNLVSLNPIHTLLFQIIHWFLKWIFSGHDNLQPTCSIHKDGLEAYRWCRLEI